MLTIKATNKQGKRESFSVINKMQKDATIKMLEYAGYTDIRTDTFSFTPRYIKEE